MIKNLPQIVLLNIVGLALFLSWYIPVNHGFWLPIDADIFYFFNQKLVESKGRCEQVPDMRSCLSSGAMEQGSS